jgi:hypothetical protein
MYEGVPITVPASVRFSVNGERASMLRSESRDASEVTSVVRSRASPKSMTRTRPS